jgi:holo-[acyl-carrier protein] synthase
MLYTGVDLIEIDRIGRSASRWGDKFLTYVYTPAEIAYCRGRAPELAARYAAKEAAGKALGSGVGWGAKVWWVDIEVVTDAHGRPSLRLHRVAAARAERLKWKHVSLTLTHARDLAMAMVVAEADE